MRKINVGLTIQINDKDDSFWVNGIKQNTVTLQEMFSHCPNVGSSKFINLGSLKDYRGTVWEPFADDIIDFDACLEQLDVVITATVSFSSSMIDRLESKGIAIVKHIMGNEYAIFSEQMLFKDESTNASPVHFVIMFVVNAAAPDTATVAVPEPSKEKSAIPEPCVKAFGTFSTDKLLSERVTVVPSATLVFNIVPSTASFAIVKAPSAAIVASPLTPE